MAFADTAVTLRPTSANALAQYDNKNFAFMQGKPQEIQFDMRTTAAFLPMDESRRTDEVRLVHLLQSQARGVTGPREPGGYCKHFRHVRGLER